MSFQAEVQVFEMALKRDFKAQRAQVNDTSDIYYSLKAEHREIDWRADGETIMRQVRAFGTWFGEEVRLAPHIAIQALLEPGILVTVFLER